MYAGHWASVFPDKAAIIRAATGEIRTYRELDERSNRLAQLLHAHGLRRGDHVAVYLENDIAFLEVQVAAMRSGLYFTPINHHLTAAEAAYIVDNSDARVLVVTGGHPQARALGELSPRCEVKLAVGTPTEGFVDYEAALAGQPATPLAEQPLGAMMLYSSGTTGRPKGICRPLVDGSIEQGSPQSQLLVDVFGLTRDTVYLSPAPLYHASPTGFCYAVLQAGGTVVFMDRFDAEAALQLIEKYRITHSQWVPTMLIRMLKLDPEIRARHDLSSMVSAIHAAAPCPVDVKRALIEWWGPIVMEYYSSTESVGFATVTSEEWLAHPGTVGRSRGAPFHICDDDGNELPPGTPGLIYGEAAAGVQFSYHKDPDKSASVTHPAHANWKTVGDIGYLDEDGFLYLTDRKSFMIISGGVNIYPQQIENVLALHPKLADVAVIGVPNAELGEEVKAVVEVAPGVEPSPELAAELLAFVTERLGRQLTPRSVDFIDQLPRLPTGKLYKQGLKDKYWGKAGADADAGPAARP
jgi:long-chain acyl-CoA synthetase